MASNGNNINIIKHGKFVKARYICEFCRCEFEVWGKLSKYSLDGYIMSDSGELRGNWIAKCACPDCGYDCITRGISYEEVDEEELKRLEEERDEKIQTLKDKLGIGPSSLEADPFKKMCPKW